MSFQSTLPLRGATSRTVFWRQYQRISIHAPLTGSDFLNERQSRKKSNFNPRSPYGERPKYFNSHSCPDLISIHAPLTGSDEKNQGGNSNVFYFNPRSPYGERPPNCWPTAKRRLFQSTLPLRGATTKSARIFDLIGISIHAPLTGSDPPLPGTLSRCRDFNPRSPYGERLWRARDINFQIRFQSTLPLRGATGRHTMRMPPCVFQSTLPLRGATQIVRQQGQQKQFQSTLPLRGATARLHKILLRFLFK